MPTRICSECEREFDLTDPAEAEEWFYGHDCEDLEVLEAAGPKVHPSWDYVLPTQFQGPRR